MNKEEKELIDMIVKQLGSIIEAVKLIEETLASQDKINERILKILENDNIFHSINNCLKIIGEKLDAQDKINKQISDILNDLNEIRREWKNEHH